MTPEQRAALDLFLAFETPHSDHFSAQLFRLFQKADVVNVRRLSRGYPVHGGVFQEWRDSPTTQEFYDKYDVRRNYKADGNNPAMVPCAPGMPPVLDDPIPEDLRQVMNELGRTLDEVIGKHADNPSCFMLMVFDIGEKGTTSYISNAQREDVIKLMQEFIDKQQ
jgi:hypothetical protein